MIRSRVCLGMCFAEGASLSTAETVPAESPTCAATAFSVTTFPFAASAFLIWVICEGALFEHVPPSRAAGRLIIYKASRHHGIITECTRPEQQGWALQHRRQH